MFCTYTRPRYQVSVYNTIGPLVLFCLDSVYPFAFYIDHDEKMME